MFGVDQWYLDCACATLFILGRTLGFQHIFQHFRLTMNVTVRDACVTLPFIRESRDCHVTLALQDSYTVCRGLEEEKNLAEKQIWQANGFVQIFTKGEVDFKFPVGDRESGVSARLHVIQLA